MKVTNNLETVDFDMFGRSTEGVFGHKGERRCKLSSDPADLWRLVAFFIDNESGVYDLMEDLKNKLRAARTTQDIHMLETAYLARRKELSDEFSKL